MYMFPFIYPDGWMHEYCKKKFTQCWFNNFCLTNYTTTLYDIIAWYEHDEMDEKYNRKKNFHHHHHYTYIHVPMFALLRICKIIAIS